MMSRENWLNTVDWLQCNKCQTHPRRGASLSLTNCGHVLCLSCKENSARGECPECKQTGIQYVAITENIRERADVGHLFQDKAGQAVCLMRVLQFQKMHQQRMWEHWIEQEKEWESERWSAEELQAAEALDTEELKRRCQELEQEAVEQQKVTQLERYVAQLRIAISQQEGVGQGAELGAGPCKRPRNGSTDTIAACSPQPLPGPSLQPHPSLGPSPISWLSPSATSNGTYTYQMPPPRLPPPWIQRASARPSPGTTQPQSQYLSSDAMLQTRPVLQGRSAEVKFSHRMPPSYTPQPHHPSTMAPRQHDTSAVASRETRPAPRPFMRSGGRSTSPSPRTTPTPSPRGGIFRAAKVSAPARRTLMGHVTQSPSPRTSKPSPLTSVRAARHSSSAHTPSPRTAGTDRGGLRITPNRLLVRGPPVGGRIGTIPKYVSPNSRVAELIRASGLRPLSPAPSPVLPPHTRTQATSCTSSAGSIVQPTYQ